MLRVGPHLTSESQWCGRVDRLLAAGEAIPDPEAYQGVRWEAQYGDDGTTCGSGCPLQAAAWAVYYAVIALGIRDEQDAPVPFAAIVEGPCPDSKNDACTAGSSAVPERLGPESPIPVPGWWEPAPGYERTE